MINLIIYGENYLDTIEFGNFINYDGSKNGNKKEGKCKAKLIVKNLLSYPNYWEKLLEQQSIPSQFWKYSTLMYYANGQGK